MITSIKINNYKSLHNFEMELSEFTVVIGNNASGKSSILQAIAFLIDSVREDFNIIIEKRGLEAEDIKSKLVKSSSQIKFSCGLYLFVNGSRRKFRWDLEINIKKKTLELCAEKIIDEETGILLLEYKEENKLTVYENGKEPRSYPRLLLTSSSMKIVVDVEHEKSLPELVAIKKFLLNSASYELLSPADMRQSSRGTVKTLGISGRNLPSFIKAMTQEQKSSFMGKVHEILGSDLLEEVGAHTKGKPGWTRIETIERYDKTSIHVTSKDMSDGMLRLLAFIAISEIPKAESVMLLDEIENGININYAEALLKILQEIYEEKRHQLIVTTHSTVFIDYVKPDNIVFLYRDYNTGLTKAVKLFDNPEFKEQLQYMFPGEVLLNLSNEEINFKFI